MSERRSPFDDSSEQEGSFYGASSASLMSFSQDSSTGFNHFTTVYTPQYASPTESIAWVWGLSPRFLVSREPGLPLSSASSLNDPILRSFASHTPSGSSASPANSAIGQTAGLNTPSSSSSTETTESDEIDSYEEEPNLGEGDEELRTPATSDASGEADIIFVLDQVYGEQVAAIPSRESSLIGLQLPGEFLLSRELLHLQMRILTFS
jgi:hypothetical protein